MGFNLTHKVSLGMCRFNVTHKAALNKWFREGEYTYPSHKIDINERD